MVREGGSRVEGNGLILSKLRWISDLLAIELDSRSIQFAVIDLWSATVRAARPSPGRTPGATFPLLVALFENSAREGVLEVYEAGLASAVASH